MSLSQLQQENKFKKHLAEFWVSKGITQIKIPQIGGQQLNLYKLYQSVCRKGGGQLVSHNKMWKEIVDQFGLPSTCTSASFTLKNHYQRYLLAYQQKYFFGRDDSAELPQLVAGRMRKNIRGEDIPTINRVSQNFSRFDNEGGQPSTLQSDLQKFYQKRDKNEIISYIKRSKMYPATSQVKHMTLAFQSGLIEQTIYAINMLTLFSVNTQAPFLFHQYPNALQSIWIFLERSYPPKDILELQCLRNLTLAIRNLALNIKNLSPLIDCQISRILLKILNEKVDKELTRNVVDIFSSMTRVGWDCRDLTQMIEQYLQKDTPQDLQTSIDLLRGLVEQRQELCEEIIHKKLDLFTRLMVHQTIEIRQSVLQIFAYIIQKSEKTRNTIIKSHKFMSRLFGLLSYSHGHSQKQAQLAGFILGNITQSHQNLSILKKFQKQLMLVSFNDDSLSSITTGILYNLANPPSQQKLEVGQSKKSQHSLSQEKSSQKLSYSKEIQQNPDQQI